MRSDKKRAQRKQKKKKAELGRRESLISGFITKKLSWQSR